jgi:hypothetical protein
MIEKKSPKISWRKLNEVVLSSRIERDDGELLIARKASIGIHTMNLRRKQVPPFVVTMPTNINKTYIHVST